MAVQGEEIRFPLHITVEDASGDSAVIEFVDGKTVAMHGPQFAMAANEPFYGEQIANLRHVKEGGNYTNSLLPGGADSMNRFVRATYYGETIPAARTADEAAAYMFAAIQGTAVPFYRNYEECNLSEEVVHNGIIDDVWPSQYQTVLDHGRALYYFQSAYGGNRVVVDLAKFNLEKGQPAMELNADDPRMTGDVSGRFSPRPITTQVPIAK